MTHLKDILNVSRRTLRTNSPAILTGLGVSGSITTAFLAGRAGYKASQRLGEAPAYLTPKEKIQITWDLYIPPVVSGGVTIGCILFASRAHSRRAAAAYSLLAVSERTLEEYREKVTEVLGVNKEQAIRDDIAQDRTNKNPPTVIIGGDSDVICHELFTGRYFKSDMESLRKAQNDINAKINQNLYVTMDEFYYILGIPGTSNSHGLGWDSDKLLELEYSTVLGPDSKPCLAFDYNYIKVL